MKENFRVNFHSHSQHSDGLASVEELVQTMFDNNVKFFALTDHDTLAGVANCIQLAKKHELTCYTGIELSVSLPNTSNFMHLLAYDFDLEILQNELDTFTKEKSESIKNLAKYMQDIGYNFKLEQKNTILTTQEIAISLLQVESIPDINTAYKNINSLIKYRILSLTAKRAIGMIHKANGFAIMAHPFDIFEYATKYAIPKERVAYIVQDLNKLGLDGIEVFYANYSKEKIDFLNWLADKHNLIKSIGTDYHNRPNMDLPYLEIDLEANLLLEVLLKRKK